jgi:hypothetical protein
VERIIPVEGAGLSGASLPGLRGETGLMCLIMKETDDDATLSNIVVFRQARRWALCRPPHAGRSQTYADTFIFHDLPGSWNMKHNKQDAGGGHG